MPDRFNPLMDLDHAKNVGDGGVPVIPMGGGNTLADRYDPSANIGTTPLDVMIPPVPSPNAGTGSATGCPAGVDRFGG